MGKNKRKNKKPNKNTTKTYNSKSLKDKINLIVNTKTNNPLLSKLQESYKLSKNKPPEYYVRKKFRYSISTWFFFLLINVFGVDFLMCAPKQTTETGALMYKAYGVTMLIFGLIILIIDVVKLNKLRKHNLKLTQINIFKIINYVFISSNIILMYYLIYVAPPSNIS